MPSNVWNTQCAAGNVFRNPLAYPSSSHERIPTPWDHPDAGRVSERTCTGQLVTEDGDEGKGAIPNPRFLRSASTANSFDPVIRRNCTNYGVDQQRLQIPELHFDRFTTAQTFFVLEDKVQVGSVLLFKFLYGSHVMDQRCRDGYFSWRF